MDKNIENINTNINCSDFQEMTSNVLIRHKSILDIITKLDEYNARINRAVIKSVTSCGCISIDAKKQEYNSESLEELKKSLKSHLEGELCEVCSEKIEEEIGSYLFYLAALCDTLEINLSDILNNEYDNLKTLGIYNLK
ncbi:DUF1573 domain-containing protein [Sporanaerobacter acetigenes]|uniref:DUF1573 domain-containing protein n=1 Tax=Sporanaerobacter acetigenes DSM 13106 TaxID=1123281 RepID=A0A1M5YR25_9FIRM|nr:DUF1573 domain-containing protein [Sporanaerobacter acetigenes]SHI14329.1 hypothetical protein SAMN02745180_02378 [Sporanaerobacter acetigenes DSM 13106]